MHCYVCNVIVYYYVCVLLTSTEQIDGMSVQVLMYATTFKVGGGGYSYILETSVSIPASFLTINSYFQNIILSVHII